MSYLIIGPLPNLIGRKKSLILTFLIGGMACLLYYPLSSLGESLTYVCIALGGLGATAGFNIAYLVTTEAFPTVYRGTVFGASNVMSRVGGILAPLVDGVA